MLQGNQSVFTVGKLARRKQMGKTYVLNIFYSNKYSLILSVKVIGNLNNCLNICLDFNEALFIFRQ